MTISEITKQTSLRRLSQFLSVANEKTELIVFYNFECGDVIIYSSLVIREV